MLSSFLLRCCLLSLLVLAISSQPALGQWIRCSSADTCDASLCSFAALTSANSATVAVLEAAPLFCGLETTHADGRSFFSNSQCCAVGWSCRSGWNSSTQAAGGSWRSGFDCVQDGSAAYQASLDRIEPPRAVPNPAGEFCPADDNCFAVTPMQNFSCRPTCSESSPCPAPASAIIDSSPILYCGLTHVNLSFAVNLSLAGNMQDMHLPSCCHTGWQCRDGFEVSLSLPFVQINMSGYDCLLPPQTTGTTGLPAPPSASPLLGASSASALAAAAFSASSSFHPRQMQYAEQLNSSGQSLYDACESLSSCYPLTLPQWCSASCAAGAECLSPDVIACGGAVSIVSEENHVDLPACCQTGWECTDGFSAELPMPPEFGLSSVNVSGFSCQLPQPTAAVTAAAAATSATALSSFSTASPSSSSFGSSDSSSSSLASTGVKSLQDTVNEELQQLSDEYHVSRAAVVAVAVAAAVIGLSLLLAALFCLHRLCCVHRVKYSAMSAHDDAHDDVGLQHVSDLPIDDGREQTEWERDAVLEDGEKQEPDGI